MTAGQDRASILGSPLGSVFIRRHQDKEEVPNAGVKVTTLCFLPNLRMAPIS
jgi:hypothetical protein